MAKADRGTKRQCLKCGTRFYDLNADPILCPSCGANFVLESNGTAEAKSAELDDTKDDEVEVDSAAVAAGAEIVSFDEAEEEEESEDDAIADVDDVDDVDDIGGEVDNSFIDDDDDDDDELGIPVERRSDDD